MKKIFFLSSLLLVVGFTAYSQLTDTARLPPPDTGDAVVTPNEQNANGDNTANNASTTSYEDSLRRRADSLSFMNSYEAQKADPSVLYPDHTKLRGLRTSGIIGFIIVLGLGIYLFTSTNLCRDLSYDPKTNELRPLKDRPFSYSRVQLFWWTMIVLGCYVSFFIYAPPINTLLALNPTAIILLGGGLATSIFGRIMDNNQIARDNDNSDPDVPVRHQDTEKTNGLFHDIMSDEGGITIHRFQAVIFNLIFGLGFIMMFFSEAGQYQYPFPDFETWQLTLLGISAAGYLGLKANENAPQTLEKRQVEAVKKNDPTPPPPVGDVPAVKTMGAESSAPVPMNAFQVMKAKLHAKGLMHN
jgi:hypothetical protein